ncbi:hypothetical protein LCGC14_1323200 [marine sediment metagenome]|uniref:Uncharacterized protein n=1 Tax=marine sediment metagenome TaxID=412755 RepID=A0A0F9MZP6_9ZZZZ
MRKCPKCKKFGLEAIGNGFMECIWKNCHYTFNPTLEPRKKIKKLKMGSMRVGSSKLHKDNIENWVLRNAITINKIIDKINKEV